MRIIIINKNKLNIDYPYNLCFDLKAKRKINLEVEDRGAQVKLYPHCSAIECTVVPEVLTDLEINKLLDDSCGSDNDCKERERQNINNAKGNLELKLKVSSCFPETTKVEFIITPREGIAGKEVKIFEMVPKECIKDLKQVLKKVVGGDGDVIIKSDPMLVWPFTTISEEQKVSYEISKFLDDNCRKQLKAVVAVKEVEEITPPEDRKPHPLRFEPEHTDLGKIPEDKKGKEIFLSEDPATGEIISDEEPQREEEDEELPVEVGEIVQREIFRDRKRDILDPKTICNLINLDGIIEVSEHERRICRRLEYEIEEIGGDGEADCEVKDLKIICKGEETGTANFKLKIINRDDEVIGEKEFSVTVS